MFRIEPSMIEAKLLVSYYLTQYPAMHHPLETNYDSIMDEPQLSSTLITHSRNPPIPPFPYLGKHVSE